MRLRRSRSPWDEESLIRAEIFGPERFAQHARSLSDSHMVVGRKMRVVSIVDRLEENATRLREIHRQILDDLQADRPITPAAEWLVDNYYVIERNVRQIRHDLPPSYFRELPKLGPGFLGGHPRIFGVMWAYVAHTDSLFDPQLLATYVRAYEARKHLTIGELWAVAITLRLLLIENARRVGDLIAHSSAERRRADELADRLLAAGSGEGLLRAAADAVSGEGAPSRAFAVQLLRRLRGRAVEPVSEWVQANLRQSAAELERVVDDEHHAMAAATVTMRNIFTSLRLISDVNWEDWLESVSLVDAALRENPTYPALDFTTRNMYRSAVEDLARKAGCEELHVARAALNRARIGKDELRRDLGYWLLDDGRPVFKRSVGARPGLRTRMMGLARRIGLAGYLGAAMVWTIAALAGTAALVDSASGGDVGSAALILLSALAVLPLADLVLGLGNHWVIRVFAASPLPALAMRNGIPAEHRTMVVIPALLGSAEEAEELVGLLEVHYLANESGEIYFALVSDWTDSDEAERPGDQEIVDRAAAAIASLNERYRGERFLLLHRARRFNPAEGVWMGWERKRGKLVELGRLLRGAGDTTFETIVGRIPTAVRFVVTLDSDTGLPRESVRKLVGKMAHPLNRARINEDGRVWRGYGILQPRLSPSLPISEESSVFQRVFSTPPGLDPYAFAVSDVYQDLFGEGSFAGKGVYDVDVMASTADKVIPENAVLSHDLLEGNLARSGLVTDVEMIEQYPMTYEVVANRSHRWVRGDWQLLPFILDPRNGISCLGRWKMVDNLRRAMTPPVTVLAILTGVALLGAESAGVYAAIVLSPLFVPQLLPLVGRAFRWQERVTTRSQARSLGSDLARSVLQGLLTFALLADQAWRNVDATARALVRMLITRRHLLQWTTAARAAAQAEVSAGRYLRLMGSSVVIGLAVIAAGAVEGRWSLLLALVLGGTWVVAPFVARSVSTPFDQTEITASAHELARLREVARRTWGYFETFVTEDHNHLPPDNFQEDPVPVEATRTSPTNIGLYLLSVVAARDFGWIGLREAADRIERSLDTVDRLEHHRGHLYNWYDTQTLAPLFPRYISTVDNGNFAGQLITLANACEAWAREPLADRQPAAGLRDVVRILEESLDRGAVQSGEGFRRTVAELRTLGRELGALPDAGDGELDRLADRADTVAASVLDLVSADDEALAWAAAVRRTAATIRDEHANCVAEDPELHERLARLAERARAEALGMDFLMLYNKRRNLLSIGYQVEEARLDENCYDLLASEARLASFFAIAKGDLATPHWFRLGRSVTAVGGGAALLSWSGSMFEYLMPHLIMRAPSDGLLSRTAQLVVQRQISYGHGLGVPWGVSESAYNVRDIESTYQYSQFGVPDLGIVRGLAENLVIAPYATALAAMVAPDDAAANYRQLTRLGARGRFGFYEAVDFTRSRLPKGEHHAVVRCYMAHHQGMTIVAIHNAVQQGLMRDRFHEEPIVRAAELLLQERAPREVPVTTARRDELEAARNVRSFSAPADRRFSGAAIGRRTTHLLANSSMSLMLTPAGAGQLRAGSLAVTRWDADMTSSPSAEAVYLRDIDSGEVWSAEPTPIVSAEDRCEVRFAEDQSSFVRTHGSVVTELEHHLSPESNTVVRRLTVRNRSWQERTVDVVTYAELALARPEDDRAHPAFSKLFVHTEFDKELGALIATRRRRDKHAPEVWAAQFLTVDNGEPKGELSFESDRARFIGRMRDLQQPAWLDPDHQRAGRDGYVLDPILSLTQQVQIGPRGFARLLIWTVVAHSRDELLELIDQHRAGDAYERVGMLSWTQSQIQMQHLGISADEASQYQELAGYVVFPDPALRPPEAERIRDAGPQSALWPLGISGDRPIVVLRIDDPEQIDVVRELIQAVDYWRVKRFSADLVILNDRTSSYVEDLQSGVEALIRGMRAPLGEDLAPAEVYVLRSDQLAPQTLSVLTSAARVVMVGRHGSLAAQLKRVAAQFDESAVMLQPSVRRAAPSVPAGPPPAGDLALFNGYGGFDRDSGEYVVTVDDGRPTPAPWTNVIAGPSLGFHATAEGAGYTWWGNSRDNQLTPWRNDPVTTPVSEAFYLQRDDDGRTCSPTALPLRGGRHVARHGFGYTEYEHDRDDLGLNTSLLQLVAESDAVKVARLRLTNTGQTTVTWRVTWYAEPVLGFHRSVTAHHLISRHDERTGALMMRNPWTTVQGDQVVFADMCGRQRSFTGDRLEFLGRHGTTASPAAISRSKPLSGRVGAGLDPALALQTVVTLTPGQSEDVVVLLGAADGQEAARDLVQAGRAINPDYLRDRVSAAWKERVGAVQVRTPDPSFDVMMNGWLLYQTLACRMTARSGYYQASGAFGFRDQLQDSMAAVLVDPALAREHLLRAAGRQFIEGDVQHWWLPAAGNGVRTRISDDVVWLAHATARYVRVTGDVAVLDEQLPYLEGQMLLDGEHDAFFTPMTSAQVEPLYGHCVRALEHAFRFGLHGLPLMGTGDWNDGMNTVGEEGRGESVWLGWFLHRTLSDFIPIAQARGDTAFAERCAEVQERLLGALESAGWDGDWYRRAYFDNGAPLGTASASECRIDAIAQSWAVLSGAAQPERARAAMESLDRELIMADEGVARLFTPPLDKMRPNAGYIQAYPPGVRENGGQYTHGAIWSIFAHAALGNQERAAEIFSMINPVNHSRNAEEAERYRVEPYVVAADIYSVDPHVGRGGWTWYTGASGWLFRAGLEVLLGLRVEGDTLVVDPCLPPGWDHAEVTLRAGTGTLQVRFEAHGPAPRRLASLSLDGWELEPGDAVPLPADGGEHVLVVRLEGDAAAKPPADGVQ